MRKGAQLQPPVILQIAGLLQLVYFAREYRRIEHNTITDDTGLLRVQYSGRNEMKNHLSFSYDNSVAGIGAPLIAHDRISILAEQIDYFAFALITPLEAECHHICHESSPLHSMSGSPDDAISYIVSCGKVNQIGAISANLPGSWEAPDRSPLLVIGQARMEAENSAEPYSNEVDTDRLFLCFGENCVIVVPFSHQALVYKITL